MRPKPYNIRPPKLECDGGCGGILLAYERGDALLSLECTARYKQTFTYEGDMHPGCYYFCVECAKQRDSRDLSHSAEYFDPIAELSKL